MFGINWGHHPLSRLIKDVKKLDEAVVNASRKLKPRPQQSGAGVLLLKSAQLHLKEMSLRLKSLSQVHRAHGIIHPTGVAVLVGIYKALKVEMGRLEQQLTTEGTPLSQHPLLKEVYRKTTRLEPDIKKVMQGVDRQSGQSGTDIDDGMTVQLMAAVKKLDKQAAKNVQMEDLLRWCHDFLPIDWDDAELVLRMVRIYLLAQAPFQVWEVRHRSEAPGRPLILLTESETFPDEELLDFCNENYGFHREYYIAARYPSWRVVWKSSR